VREPGVRSVLLGDNLRVGGGLLVVRRGLGVGRLVGEGVRRLRRDGRLLVVGAVLVHVAVHCCSHLLLLLYMLGGIALGGQSMMRHAVGVVHLRYLNTADTVGTLHNGGVVHGVGCLRVGVVRGGVGRTVVLPSVVPGGVGGVLAGGVPWPGMELPRVPGVASEPVH